MNRMILCIFGFALVCSPLYAQKKLPDIYLDHLSITVDSVTYNQLFDSAFFTNKFANVDSSASTSTKYAWAAKYMEGKNGYFEFFRTTGSKGASTGDLGLGFVSLRAGDIWKIKAHWLHSALRAIVVDTTFDMVKGKRRPWFYSIRLFRKDDSLEGLSTRLAENIPEDLPERGFSKEQIEKQPIWKDYVERHRAFLKLFDRIRAVHISITAKEYQYLRKSLLGFGLREKGNGFVNDHVTIAYTIVTKPVIRIRSIEVQLTEPTPNEDIRISGHVVARISGNRAIFEFQY